MSEQDQFTNHYAVLGIYRSATAQQIRGAFRRRALQLHPDKVVDKASAHERFIALKKAFDTLSKPGEKDHYDALYDSLFNHNQYDGRPYDDFGYFGLPNTVTIGMTSAFEPDKHSTHLPINVAIELSDTNLIPFLTKGVTLPASRTEIISTAYSGSDTCVFSIWSLVSDKRSLIGKFQLEGLPVVFGGLAWVELTIMVDDDKLLQVSVRVMSGGR